MKIKYKQEKLKIEILAGAVIDEITALEKRGFHPRLIERGWSENDR